MILHFSHIGLTDGRTFTLASLSSWNNFPVVPRRGSGDRYGRRYLAEKRTQRETVALQAQRRMLAGAVCRPWMTRERRSGGGAAPRGLVPGGQNARSIGRHGDREL